MQTSSNSNKSTISVIIPAYNAEKTIERAIHSVQSQSRSADEILIVDDSSSDNTVPTIREAFSGEEISLLQHETRKGPGVARNTGISNSNGDIVAFLDADDEWKETKLKIQRKRMKEHNSSISTTDLDIYCNQDVHIRTKRIQFYDSVNNNIRALYHNEIDNITPTLMFKKELYEEIGPLPALRWKEDHLFIMKALQQFEHIHVQKSLTRRHLTGTGYSTGLNRNYQAELQAYEEFNNQALKTFPFLESDENKFLSCLYFRMSEKMDLPPEKWNHINPFYLSFNQQVKYWLRQMKLGWSIPFIRSLKGLFSFGNGL